MVTLLGARLSLLLGVLGYAALVLSSLLLATVGGPGASPAAVAACRAGVVGGGALLGLGAALLWTAQGVYVREGGIAAQARARSGRIVFPFLLRLRNVRWLGRRGLLFPLPRECSLGHPPMSPLRYTGRLMLAWSDGTDQGSLFSIF